MAWKRFIAAFDVHGDKQDKAAVASFFKFCERWNPHIRVAGGDIFDFRPLRKKACEEERRESMEKDFNMGMEWLKQYDPKYFIRGNHDERLWDLAHEDRGVISDYALKGTLEISNLVERMGCKMLPYDSRTGILRLGKLKIIHGFFAGDTAARKTALVYGSCLFGHVHAIDEAAIAGLERRVARACGCLCDLDMNYERSKPAKLRKAHGWAYGVIDDRTGFYHVYQAEKIGGKWLLPTGLEEL